MTQCTDGTWCCGARNLTNCCDRSLGFELKAELVTFNAKPVTISATRNSVPSATQAVVKATNTVMEVVYRTRDNPSDSSKITGLAIGMVLLGLVGACGGYWLGRGKWRTEQQDGEKTSSLTINDISGNLRPDLKPLSLYDGQNVRNSVYEVGQFPRNSELPAELGSEK